MTFRILAVGLVLLSGLALAQSTGPAGRYHASVEGVGTVLTLDAQLAGSYAEGELRFNVRGTQQGGTLRLSVRDPASDLEIAQIEGPLQAGVFDARIRAQNPLTGEQRESQARFVREGTNAGGKAPPASAAGALDARLVGVWTSSETLGGGGGPNPGVFSTERTAEISADGRISQWAESAGGGGDWSYGSGRKLEFSGRWQARAGILYVQTDGAAGFEPATRYRFADPYLVTESNSGKTIWQRR